MMSVDPAENVVASLMFSMIHCDLSAYELAQADIRHALAEIGFMRGHSRRRSGKVTRSAQFTLESAGRRTFLCLPFVGRALAIGDLTASSYARLFRIGDRGAMVEVERLEIRYFRLRLRFSRLKASLERLALMPRDDAWKRDVRLILSGCLDFEVDDVDKLTMADDYLALASGLARIRDLPMARVALHRADEALSNYDGTDVDDVAVVRRGLSSLRQELRYHDA